MKAATPKCTELCHASTPPVINRGSVAATAGVGMSAATRMTQMTAPAPSVTQSTKLDLINPYRILSTLSRHTLNCWIPVINSQNDLQSWSMPFIPHTTSVIPSYNDNKISILLGDHHLQNGCQMLLTISAISLALRSNMESGI